MKTLIIMSAIPGSGKSTWAKKYQKEHPNTYIVSSDEIRYQITKQYQDFSKQDVVWDTFYKEIIRLSKIEDVTVISDALNDTNEVRIAYINRFKKLYDRFILIIIKRDLKDVLIFNKQRVKEKWVPDDAFEKLVKRFEPINNRIKKMYDEVIEINDHF